MSASRVQRRAPADGGALASTGLLIVNPPYTLQGELKTILPELEMPLGQGGAARIPIGDTETVTLRHSWEKYAGAVVNLQRTVLCCFRDRLYVPLPRMVAAE